jgi:hypothetical protein
MVASDNHRELEQDESHLDRLCVAFAVSSTTNCGNDKPRLLLLCQTDLSTHALHARFKEDLTHIV